MIVPHVFIMSLDYGVPMIQHLKVRVLCRFANQVLGMLFMTPLIVILLNLFAYYWAILVQEVGMKLHSDACH